MLSDSVSAGPPEDNNRMGRITSTQRDPFMDLRVQVGFLTVDVGCIAYAALWDYIP